MRRVKHHCCFRLEQGRRAGLLCKQPIDGWLTMRSDLNDYCSRHRLMILEREEKRQEQGAVIV